MSLKISTSKMFFVSILFIAAVATTGVNPVQANNFSFCEVKSEDDFFAAFKCPKLTEIAWTGKVEDLNAFSKAEIISYIGGLMSEVHGPSAAYYLHPNLLIARDPKLPYKISMKSIADRNVIDDTLSDGLNLLEGMLKGFVDERMHQKDNEIIDPLAELQALGKGLSSIGGSAIIWAGKYGAHDFHTLANISQSDPDTAIGIYNGLSGIVDAL